jgi:hypothetical protein
MKLGNPKVTRVTKDYGITVHGRSACETWLSDVSVSGHEAEQSNARKDKTQMDSSPGMIENSMAGISDITKGFS